MKAVFAPPILVLGMHRSGTSYLASRLQAMGLDLGKDLVGAQPGNPRGHFEDRSVLAFHEKLIADRRSPAGWAFDREMMVTERLPQPWTPEEQAQAEALVEARQSARPWGWKEPRTALFLPAWRELLPDLRAVVIYRHPLAVHFSAFRRRHWDLAVFPDQVFRAYATYNRELLRAIAERPEQFLIVHADTAFGDLDRLDDALARFLPSGLGKHGSLPVFHPDEFASLDVPPEAEELLAGVVPEAVSAYAELNARAQISASERPGGVPGEAGPRFPWLDEWADWSQGRRSLAIPLLETLWFEGVFSPGSLRRELAEEIGRKVRETEQWNERAQRIFEDNKRMVEDNERMDAERTRLGEAFAEQQAFLHRHTEDFKKLWANHQRLGDTWVKQNEHIAAQAERIQELEKHVRELAGEPVEAPPQP